MTASTRRKDDERELGQSLLDLCGLIEDLIDTTFAVVTEARELNYAPDLRRRLEAFAITLEGPRNDVRRVGRSLVAR